jgi:glycosidase
MQWDDSEHAGFTDGTPWLAVNPNHETVNVEAARDNPNSVYHYYRRLLRLRQERDVLVYGDYTLLAPDHPTVYAYCRTLGEETLVVLLNFSDEPVEYEWPDGAASRSSHPLCGTHREPPALENSVWLRPYEGRIDEIESALSDGSSGEIGE